MLNFIVQFNSLVGGNAKTCKTHRTLNFFFEVQKGDWEIFFGVRGPTKKKR